MPTYEYSCPSCGARPEVVQSMSDAALTVCPECGAEGLRKLFGNVGVHFKGSGFYRTDSRKATAGGEGKSSSASSKKSESSSSSSSAGSSSTGSSSSGSSSSSSSSSSSGSSSSTSGSSAA